MKETLMKKIAAPFFVLCMMLVAGGAVAAGTAVLHGNPETKIYHNKECKFYNCKKCTVVFKTAADAKKQGFKPCKKCGG